MSVGEESEDEEEDNRSAALLFSEWLLSSFTSSLLLLCERIEQLHSLTLTLADISETSARSSLSTRFYALFHCLFSSAESLPSTTPSLLLALFSHHLRTFQRLHSLDSSDASSSEDEAEHLRFVELCRQLHAIQLLSPSSPISSSLLSSLFLPVLRAHISDSCDDPSISHLSSLLTFTSTVLLPFASLLLPSTSVPSSLLSSTAHLYCLHLISRVFDLIIAFPASTPLLSDLHDVLPLTSLQPTLLSSLTSSLHRRLLHPGASTPDILHTLIGLVRGLRVVEDDGVMAMEAVKAITDYVRTRPDCIRCVLRMIVGREDAAVESSEEAGGDGEVDLSEELEMEPEKDFGDDSDTETTKPTSPPPAQPPTGDPTHPFSARPPGTPMATAVSPLEGWTPDPLSAHPYITSRKGRHADLLTILFSLTPPSTPAQSLTPILDEYRGMLAGRLIGRPGYSRDEEVVRNERMKSRVGDEEMATCEVMVRDIENSKRILTRVVREVQHTFPSKLPPLTPGVWVDAMKGMEGSWTLFILSHEYWPAELLEASLALSSMRPFPQLLALQALAGETYHRLFAPRTLTFLPLLGSVDVTVELQDRSLQLHCDPLALSVLQAFEGEGVTLSLEAVVKAVGLSEDEEGQVEAVTRKLGYWMSQNVLREMKESPASASTMYQVIEELSSEDVYEGGEEDEGEEGAGAGVQGGGDGVDVYVMSLLTTFGELSCDRLHVYLKRFGVTSDFVYSWQEMQLQDHLQAMEQRGKITQKDGIYRKK